MIKFLKGVFVNTKTNVRTYTDEEILGLIRSLPSFRGMPKGDHLFFVRSNEKQTNVFGDKVYYFKNEKFQEWSSCTTVTGRWGLRNFRRYNKKGVAVIKSNEIYYDAFMKSDGKKVRHHRDKIQCLRLIKDILYYRDGNMNDKVEEIGPIYKDNYHTNIHPNSYKFFKGIRTWLVNKSSLGCLVLNNLTKYWKILNAIPLNTQVTVTIIDEKPRK